MTKPPLPTIRGRRSAIFSRDKRAVSVLTRQLDLLGITAAANPAECDCSADIVFLDVDTTMESNPASFGLPPKIPVIALVGTETPGRLEWMMSHEPSAVLIKPLAAHGIYATLVVAFSDVRRREQEFLRVLKLEERIRARRIVVAAIIRLMKQYGIEEPEAFGMLRNAAQQRRMTIENLSAEVAGNAFLPVRLATTR